jgi:hypothetical protein
MPLALLAAILSRMRSPVTSRSNWAKDRRHCLHFSATAIAQSGVLCNKKNTSWGNAEVFSVARSAGMRCQNQQRHAADFVSHRKTTLFRWRALRNPGWIYSAFP